MVNFINIVEEQISNLFTSLYNTYIVNNKLNNNLKKNKTINNINDYLFSYVNQLEKSININELKKIINKEENIIKIIIIIKKYIIYYLLLIISFYMKEELYKDFIIKLQKLNDKNKLLLNSEDSIVILNQYNFLKKFLYVLNLFNNDKEEFNKNILRNNTYKNIILFINQEVSEDNIKILIGNDINTYHNNIFFILIKNLYIKNDIKKVYNILEDNNNIIYTTIDIVVPLISFVDEELISDILFKNEKKKSIIKDFFHLLKNEQKFISEDEKINILMKHNIIYPILDDFLRYHKDSEIYEKDNNTKFDKSNTKIKYIISKVNEIQNYYIKDKTEQAKLDQNFYKRLITRKAILYNELEEINIIRKIFLKGKKAVENNEFINNLIDIRKYAYLNYNTIKSNGFSYKFNDTISAVRYSNFEFKNSKIYKIHQNEDIETRVAPKKEKVNIVGLLFSNKKITNLIIKNIENIKINNDLNKFIYNFFSNNNKSYYWLFDNDDYKYIKFNQKNFNYDSNDNESICKYIILFIYDLYTLYIYDTIIKKINEVENPTLFKLYKIVNKIQLNSINIEDILKKQNIDDIIYNKIKNYKDDKMLSDINENIIKGLEGKIIKLPKIKKSEKKKTKLVFESNKKKEKSENIFEKYNYTCQHEIDYNELKNYNTDNNLYSEKVFKFINKYSYTDKNVFLCKSCHKILDIKKYIVNIHNLSGEEGFNIDLNYSIDFKNNNEYKNYLKLIEYIDKLIDRISLITNIPLLLGNTVESKFNRKKITKKVIDTINENYKLYIKLSKKEKEINIIKFKNKYNISLNYSKFFIFKLTDDIFKFKSKEEDKYKKRKINNIILYIIFFMLLELNKNHIINLNEDKLCNIIIFKKYYKIVFESLNIKINNSNDVIKITTLPILCYYLFYFSCTLIKYKLWQFEDNNNKFDFIKVKVIVNSFVDLINHICENNDVLKNSYLFSNSVSLFYFNQKNMYKSIDLLNSIEEKQSNKINYDKVKNVITLNNNNLPTIKITGKMEVTNEFQKINFICDKYIFNLKLLNNKDNLSLFTSNELSNINDNLLQNTKAKIVKNFDVNNNIRNIKLTNNELNKINKSTYEQIVKDYYNNIDNNIKSNKKIKEKDDNKNVKIDFDISILDDLISKLKNLFNNNINLLYNKIFIVANQYILNHDINGYNIEKKIYIMENNVKIVNNHNIFKQDVLMIDNKYLMYYNLYNNLYLGFKDNYNTISNKKGKFLKINYSLRNLFLLFGLDYKYHNVENMNIKNYIFDKLKYRNHEIKNLITKFLKNINLLKYNNISKANVENKYIKQYLNKITNINLYKKNGNIIFRKYTQIYNNLEFNEDFTFNLINNKYINITDILKKSNNDKYFYYFINELNSLFNINNDNVNITIFKILTHILYDTFSNSTDTFNTLDKLVYNQILMFDKINYFDDLESTDGILKDELTEEQQKEIDENKYTEKESNDALDYEVNEDDESELGEGEELIQDLD